MKKLYLIIKNIFYLIKSGKIFFALMCFGQIVSLCVVLVLNGAIKLSLSEENVEWYEDTFFEIVFDDKDDITVSDWISAASELEEWLGSDFVSCIMSGRIPDVEGSAVETIYPGAAFEYDNSEEGFTKEQYMSDEKIVLVSLYDDVPEGDYYEYGGENYKIAGKINYDSPCIPMRALPDTVKPVSTSLYLSGMVSKAKVAEITEKIQQLYGTAAEVTGTDGIDLMGIQSNNMVTAGSVISVILLAFNSFVCYYYLFDRKKKWLIVTRITGCSRREASGLYMMEMFIITCINIIVGTALFINVVYPNLVKSNSFYREIYDIKTYLLSALIFAACTLITVFVGILSTVNKSIIELKKE